MGDSAFNATLFEKILTQGAVHEGILHDDFPTDALPDVPVIERRNTYVSTEAAGFILALAPTNRTSLLDPMILGTTAKAAYNLLFISAVHSLGVGDSTS